MSNESAPLLKVRPTPNARKNARKAHRRFSRTPAPEPQRPLSPWEGYYVFRNSLETFRAEASTDFQNIQITKSLHALELMRAHLEAARIIPTPVLSSEEVLELE